MYIHTVFCSYIILDTCRVTRGFDRALATSLAFQNGTSRFQLAYVLLAVVSSNPILLRVLGLNF